MTDDAMRKDTTTVAEHDRAPLLGVLRRASDPRWAFRYGNRVRTPSAGCAAAATSRRPWSTCMRVVTARPSSRT